MQSTRSFFNRAVFGKTVKRYWPLWVMYLLVWTLAMGLCAHECGRRYWTDIGFDYRDMLQFAWQFGLISAAIVSCVSTMLVHSWMYNSRSASAYSCLPICRGSLFTSITLAGIVPMIVCSLIACIVAFIVALFSGHFIIGAALQCFAVMSLECLFFYGLATLCASLTGHVFVLPVVYGIFNFVVVVVEFLTKNLMANFTFGAGDVTIQLGFLSPAVYLIDKIRVNTDTMRGTGLATLNNWWAFIIYAFVGVILAVCGLLIFRKRRMESASDVVAVNILKPVFKYCLCFGCALVLGLLLFTIIFEVFFTTGAPAASIVVCVCMLVGGFIGYFAAEMLIKKSFKVFRKTWRGFLISCAVIILFITALEADFFGYERHIPEIDDISSVTVRLWGEPTAFTDPDEISQVMLLHERIINNKAQTEKNIYEYYKDSGYNYSSHPINIAISYLKDDYTTVERYYNIMYSEVDKFCSDMLTFLNRPEAIISRMESAITADQISNGYIYYNYHIPANTYTKDYDEYYGTYTVATKPVAIGSVDVYADGELEYIHGNLQLTGEQAKALFKDAIMKDALAGNIGRVRPNNYGYKNKINIHIELSSKIPVYYENQLDYYQQEYIYIEDITEDAIHTVAALKELGIDLEALASSAVK